MSGSCPCLWFMTRLARRQTEWRQTIASSAIEVTGAALFEFVPTAAWATVVASGLDRHRRVDEVPVCAVLYKRRSEEHTSELQSLMRISYAVFCLKKKKNIK